MKSQFRKTSHQVFKGKDEVQKKQSVEQYLSFTTNMLARFEAIINNPPLKLSSPETIAALLEELKHYCEFVKKFSDQIDRRLLKGETIPASEKIK